MAWLRAYVDKKITSKGGGDHSRIIDFEVPDDGYRFLLPENGGPVEVSRLQEPPQAEEGRADRPARPDRPEPGAHRMSGETQNYHETRNPITQTSDYSQITLSTTAKSIMSVTTPIFLEARSRFSSRATGRSARSGTSACSARPRRRPLRATSPSRSAIRREQPWAMPAGRSWRRRERWRWPPTRRTPPGSWTSRSSLERRSVPHRDCLRRGTSLTDPTTALDRLDGPSRSSFRRLLRLRGERRHHAGELHQHPVEAVGFDSGDGDRAGRPGQLDHLGGARGARF
jgi:hypothetical protein